MNLLDRSAPRQPPRGRKPLPGSKKGNCSPADTLPVPATRVDMMGRTAASIVAMVVSCAAATGCNGYGDTKDPGAEPPGAHAQGLLKLPREFYLDHVGHVAADSDAVFVFVTGSSGGESATLLWQLDKKGGDAKKIWQASSNGSRDEPRALVRSDTLFWVFAPSTDQSGCMVYSWPKDGKSPPAQYGSTTPSQSCHPAGIAGSAADLFLTSISNGDACTYDFREYNLMNPCVMQNTQADVYDISNGTPKAIASNVRLVSEFLPNALLWDGTNLYWIEGKGDDQSGEWQGGSLMRMPRQSGSTPKSLFTIDVGSYPIGFAEAGGELYIALTSVANPSGGQRLRGCVVKKVSKQSGAATQVAADPTHDCRGLSSDGTNAYFATDWVEADQTWREGVGRLPLAGPDFLSPVPILADNIAIRNTVLSGADLVAVSQAAVIQIPTTLLR